MNKKEILKEALEAREREIFEYQINIDNFERAIKKIQIEHIGNEEIVKFGQHIDGLLNSNRIEQTKAKIIRDVIAEQLQELEEEG